MNRHLQILTSSALAILLTTGAASAYDYGWDPAKVQAGGWYCELAQDPTYIADGVYTGKYEYFFDFYMDAGTMYYQTIAGLDNSKIANAQTHEPASFGGDFVRTQQWGEGPDSWFAAQPGWSIATGRIFDLWSKDINSSAAQANIDNLFRSSYDDGAGGWADAGLGFPEGAANNPHSYSEYKEYHAFGADVWKAELTGPGQPLQWQLSNNWLGDEPAQDTILIMGTNGVWATTLAQGLIATVRVVYDEIINPATIGWGSTAGENPVLGDFTVATPPVGSFDGDFDVDDIDIDLMGDAIRTGSTDFALFDISADGVTEGSDGVIDLLDLDYLVRFLVETSIGNGTEYGDFNLDGLIDTTDLTRLGTDFGTGDTWAKGNANRYLDLLTDNTDLTILATYYGQGPGDPDAIPEPATLGLLAMGAAGLLRRRRRA